MRHKTALATGALALLLIAAYPAKAQSSRISWLPYTSNGYIGLNIGQPEYDIGCGAGGFACEDPDASFHVYAGGQFSRWAGIEFGYLHMGEADRQGGTTRGQGLNLSLVGRVPVGQSFSLLGKVGTTWARTQTSTSPLSLEPNGDASGFGLSVALGAGFDVSDNISVVAQWDRHRMKFAGQGRRDVDAASLGLIYRF